MNKQAFTLAEVLISMAIIGTITIFALSTVQHNESNMRYIYSNTFHSLDKALYNAANFEELRNPFLTTDTNAMGAKEDVTPAEGARRLCLLLTRYINTYDANCSTENLASDNGRDLGTVKFIASNGVRFFISPRLPENANEDEPKFFLIYADLNGLKRPNSMNYEPEPSRVEPDTFAFAALDINRVCPLGPPEIDTRYILSRVQYKDQFADGAAPAEDNIPIRFSSPSKAYYISKAEAFGYYLPGSNLNTTDANNVYYIDDNPFTYNDYVRTHINWRDSSIYSFLGENNTLQVPDGIHLMSGNLNNGEYGCQEGLDEQCDVIIDKYMY